MTLPTRLIAVLLFLFLSLPGLAQDDIGTPDAPVGSEIEQAEPGGVGDAVLDGLTFGGAADLSSPRATMFAFLEAMGELRKGGDTSHWDTVYRCMGWDERPEDPYVLRQDALALWAALDHLRYVEDDQLPAADALDGGDLAFTYFPASYPYPNVEEDQEILGAIGTSDYRIALWRVDDPDSLSHGDWVFSPDTLENAGALRTLLSEQRELQVNQESANSDGRWLERVMPESLKGGGLVGVPTWQWFALGILLLILVAIDQLVRGVIRLIAVRLVKQSEGETERGSISKAARPFGLFAAGLAGVYLLGLIGLPEAAYLLLKGALAVFTMFAGIWAGWKVVDLVGEVAQSKAKRTDTKFDDVLIPMLRRAAKLFVIAVGIVFFAQVLRLPLMPLIGSLGLGSLAFAFAAKDTIENFFGSVAVILDRPFGVGDWIVIDGKTEGTVEELGFRSTRIRTFYNSQITVPNATLVRATVDNYGRRKYRRWKTHIGVQYDTPPDKLIAFTEGIRELVRTHPYTRKDYYQVWMHQWSASSMDILLYIFFEVPDWNTELRERERMYIDIVRLADRLGVQFAFPTQTVHLFREEKPAPGSEKQPIHDIPGASTDRRSMVHGLRAARELVEKQPWLDNPPGPVQLATGPMAIALDEAGNETLVEKEDKTEPTGEAPPPEAEEPPEAGAPSEGETHAPKDPPAQT
ncbi:MAG: mechanosensitive ion channel family protein [Planctomycetota bacterium]